MLNETFSVISKHRAIKSLLVTIKKNRFYGDLCLMLQQVWNKLKEIDEFRNTCHFATDGQVPQYKESDHTKYDMCQKCKVKVMIHKVK